MGLLLDAVSDTTQSLTLVATGPVLVSVKGDMKGGNVQILADIGGGFVKAYMYVESEPTSLARLELAAGVSYYAVFQKAAAGAEVTVYTLDIV